MTQEELEKYLTNNPMQTPISQESVGFHIVNPFLDLLRLSPYWRSMSAKVDALRDKTSKSAFGDITGLNTLVDYIAGDKNVQAGEAVIAPVMGVKSILDEPVKLYTADRLGVSIGPKRGRPLSITWRDVIEAFKNHGRTVFENTSEEALKSKAILDAAAKRASYKAIIAKQARKDAKKGASAMDFLDDPTKGVRNVPHGPHKKKVEETFGSEINPELTGYINFDKEFTYIQDQSAVKNFNRFIKEMSEKYHFTKSQAEKIFNKTFQKYMKKGGGIINYMQFFK